MILVVGMQDLLRATEYTGASGVYAIRCTYLDTRLPGTWKYRCFIPVITWKYRYSIPGTT